MTDIRKGDLIKATLKEDPEEYTVLRVRNLGDAGYPVSVNGFHFGKGFDFEVLERPIEEDLLAGAVEAYKVPARAQLPNNFYYDDDYYATNLKPVIEFVRQYDAKKAGA